MKRNLLRCVICCVFMQIFMVGRAQDVYVIKTKYCYNSPGITKTAYKGFLAESDLTNKEPDNANSLMPISPSFCAILGGHEFQIEKQNLYYLSAGYYIISKKINDMKVIECDNSMLKNEEYDVVVEQQYYGHYMDFLYNENTCEFGITPELRVVSLSVCPQIHFKIDSENKIVPESSTVALRAVDDGYFEHDYVWEYSVGDTLNYKQFRSGKQINFVRSDIPEAALYQDIYFRLKNCNGGSLPVTVRFILTLPDIVENNIQPTILCAGRSPEPLTLNLDRDLKPNEQITDVLIFDSIIAGKMLNIRTIPFMREGRSIQLNFNDAIEDGEYYLLLKGTLDTLSITSQTKKIRIQNPKKYQMALTSIPPQCEGFEDAVINVKLAEPLPSTALTFLLSRDNAAFAVIEVDKSASDRYLVNNLKAGLYKLKYEDANHCESNEYQVRIDERTPLSADLILSHCSGIQYNQGIPEPVDDGRIEIGTVYNSQGVYKATWSTPNLQVGEDIHNASPGNYAVTFVYNNERCTTSIETTLYRLDNHLDVSLSEVSPISCFNASDAALQVVLEKDVETIKTYRWYRNGQLLPNEQSDRLGQLSPGIYKVECEALALKSTFEYEIKQPDSLEITVLLKKEPSCYAGEDGAVSVSAKGGTAPYHYRWNDRDTSAFYQNIPAGLYSLTLKDAHNCIAYAEVELKEPKPLKLDSISIIHPSCTYASNASVRLFVSGGIKPYQYFWNHTAGTSEISNKQGGLYVYSVKDSNSCELKGEVQLAAPLAMILQDSTVKFPDYYGSINGSVEPTENNGSIAVTIVHGKPPYTYKWSTGGVDSLIRNLSSGQYILTVTDANGCEFIRSFEIPERYALISRIEVLEPIFCNGSASGILKADVQGGVGMYRYQWSTGDTTSIISGLSSGLYKLTVSDQNNVVSTFEYLLTNPDTLNIRTFVYPSLCHGDSTARITTLVNGGRPPYAYLWSNSDTGDYLDRLEQGDYSLTVTDSYGCKKDVGVSLNSPEKLNAGYTIKQPTYIGSVNGSLPEHVPDGEIEIAITGGTKPYLLTFDSVPCDTVVKGLSGGVFLIKIEDEHSCMILDSVKLELIQPLFSKIKIVSGISCFGYQDAVLDVVIEGGSPPYSCFWNGMPYPESMLTDLGTGLYTFEIVDSRGVSSVDTIYLEQPKKLGLSFIVDSLSGWKSGDGRIVPKITGGTPPYQYIWNDLVSEPKRENLPAGYYELSITDKHSCSADGIVYVGEPDSLRIEGFAYACSYVGASHGIVPEEPDNGRIESFVYGGVPPYSYVWYKKNMSDSVYDQLVHSSPNMNQLSPGAYKLIAEDKHGYRAEMDFEIKREKPLIATITQTREVSCANAQDASLSVVAEGGVPPYTFHWNLGDTTTMIDSLRKGRYSVLVTDSNGVFSLTEYHLEEPAPLRIIFEIDSLGENNACDASVKSFVYGGTEPYTYQWFLPDTLIEGQPDLYGLSAGIYLLTVSDNNQCITSSYAVVPNPEKFSVYTSVKDPPYFGSVQGRIAEREAYGEIQLFAEGGVPPYQYLWAHGDTSAFLENLRAGEYAVEIKDSKGNTIYLTVLLRETEHLVTTVLQTEFIKCYGEEQAKLESYVHGGTPPYRFYWNTDDVTPIIDRLEAGEYSLVVVDSLSVMSSFVIQVDEPALLQIDYSAKDPVCPNEYSGTITVAASGGESPYFYLWDTGDTTVSTRDLKQDDYKAVVRDINGCEKEIEVSLRTDLTLEIVAEQSLKCHGDSNASLRIRVCGGQPPYNYMWNTGDTTDFVKNLKSGVYSIRLTDSLGNERRESFFVKEPEPLSLTLSGIEPLCNLSSDGRITAIVKGGTGPYYFDWGNGLNSSVFNFADSGLYKVRVRDYHYCEIQDTFFLRSPEQIVIAYSKLDPSCFGYSDGSIELEVYGGMPSYQYLWNTNASTADLTNLEAGDYVCSIEDQQHCYAEQIISLRNPEQINLHLRSEHILCESQKLNKGVVIDSLDYVWIHESGRIFTGSAVEIDEGGLYIVIGTDYSGCYGVDSVFLTKRADSIESRFWISYDAYIGTEFIVANLTQFKTDSLKWICPGNIDLLYFDDDYLRLKFIDTGYHTVGLMTHLNGCSSVDTACIIVLEEQNEQINSMKDESISNFIFSPNPASDNVKWSCDLKDVEFLNWELLNGINGQIVLSGKVNTTFQTMHAHSLDVSSLYPGVYIFNLISQKNKMSKILIINR